MLAFLLAIIALVAGAFGGIYYVEKFDKDYKKVNDFYIEYKNFDFENVADTTELQEQLQTYVQQVADLTQELNEANSMIEYLQNNNTGVVTTKTQAFNIIFNELLNDDNYNIVSTLTNARNFIIETPETVKDYLINSLNFQERELFEEFTLLLDDYKLSENDLSEIELILLYRYVSFYSGLVEFKAELPFMSDLMIAYGVGNFLEFFQFFRNYALL